VAVTYTVVVVPTVAPFAGLVIRTYGGVVSVGGAGGGGGDAHDDVDAARVTGDDVEPSAPTERTANVEEVPQLRPETVNDVDVVATAAPLSRVTEYETTRGSAAAVQLNVIDVAVEVEASPVGAARLETGSGALAPLSTAPMSGALPQ
jgi:hypothetical protein